MELLYFCCNLEFQRFINELYGILTPNPKSQITIFQTTCPV
jgi:hypothetical protein